MKMMITYKDDYIMLCDQDDIWLSDKIEKSLRKIMEMEVEHGASTPLLVHTNLSVVDNSLKVISLSYEKMANISYSRNALHNIVVMNTVTGCTAMYNRALADLIYSEPDYTTGHDSWLALVAASFGRIGTVSEPTILYRQHDSNEDGANNAKNFGYILHRLTHYRDMVADVNKTYRQSMSLLSIYHDRLSENHRNLLASYASILSLSRISRLRALVRYRTFKQGLPRVMLQVLMMLIEKREEIIGQ
jgi:hypothetical protein